MGFFDFFKTPDINQGAKECSATPIFVYCYSGSRSSQAAGRLKKMGYQNIKNIGGISSWSGDIEQE